MARSSKEKRRRALKPLVGFLFMVLYAVLFMAAAAKGLEYLWDFLDAYEQSRPNKAIDRYVAQLDAEYVADQCDDLIAQVDHNIQSEEACRQYILDFLKDGITYFKKSSECTEEKQVFILRSGGKDIGRFEIAMEGDSAYGFTNWVVAGDSFDLSFLIGESVSTMAPHNYPVYANGVLLDESYITQTGIQYEVLADYYDDFDLPHMVVYEAGPCLGETAMQVCDPEGNPVTIDENTDMSVFLPRCTDEELAQVEDFLDEYLYRYVAYMSNYNSDTYYNLGRLREYILPGSSLDQRMVDTVASLIWVTCTRIRMGDVNFHLLYPVEGGTYICDLTYSATIDTTVGTAASTTTGGNLTMILVTTEDGLKVETMIRY